MGEVTVAPKVWERFRNDLRGLRTAVEELRTGMKTFPVTVNELADETWTLAQPFTVTVEERGPDDLTACFYDADVYGYGETIPEALEDLKVQLVNQLEFLLAEDRRVRLGPVPRWQLTVLEGIPLRPASDALAAARSSGVTS